MRQSFIQIHGGSMEGRLSRAQEHSKQRQKPLAPGWRSAPTQRALSSAARSSICRARARSPGPPSASVAPTLRSAHTRSARHT